MTMPHSPFDPELAAFLTATSGMFPLGMTHDDIAKLRAMGEVTAEMTIGEAAVTVTDTEIAGYDGAAIFVTVIAPRDRAPSGAGIYHMHGGGMVMGNRFIGADVLARWAVEHGAVCVSVEYRLASEHQAPTLVEDCYAGLVWMAENAAALGVDPDRIVVFGGSAGGGLAAGTALLARDRGGPRLLGQILQCPMIDDRSNSGSAVQLEGLGVWDRQCNVTAWRAVLGEAYGTDQVDPYSAPARMADLSNLPATFIDVGATETFRDEAIDYARRIMAAGGACELHVWPGAFHGFYSIMPQAAVSRACTAARDAWLGRLLSR